MARVRYLGDIKTLTGKNQEVVNVSSVRRLLSFVRREYGLEAYRIAKSGHIIVDGEAARFSSKLGENSMVCLLPVCGGG